MFTRPVRSIVSARALTRLAVRPVAFSFRYTPSSLIARPLSTTTLLRSAASSSRATVTEEVEQELLEEDESAVPLKTFKSIETSLHAPVYRAVTDKPFRYETMSEVQAAVLDLLPRLSCSPSKTPLATTAADIPDEVQQAQDVLVRAKTGTGKTLAFLIPALEGRLRSLESYLETYKMENPEATPSEVKKALATFAKQSVGALILSPTRELATQIANEAIALTTHLPQFGVRLWVGGASRSQQLREWSRAPSNDIVVATPGRCVDLLESENMVRGPLANTRMLILDEADTLLDMGFSDAIDTVTEHLPDNANRQTFLFSATVSKQIREISRQSLKKDHVFIDTVRADDVDTHMHIPQYHTVLPTPDDQLIHVLRLLAHDQLLHARKAAENGGVDGGKAVIFLPTTRMTQLFSLVIQSMRNHLPYGRDTNIIEIHSKKGQDQRTRASEQFRKAKTGYSILVTSDVSARGVDYPGVTRVIQVGVPGSRDLYIHRVGRTGRAGKQGRGDLVVLPWEKSFVSSQLNDVPLQPCTIADTQRELSELATEWDANPGQILAPSPTLAGVKAPNNRRSLRDREARPIRVSTVHPPVTPRLEELPLKLTTDVLPALDELSIKETFASLLGYYIPKSHELHTSKESILEGLKEWSTGGMGLQDEPYVSAAFLSKIGMKEGGRSRGGGGGGSRGGYRSQSYGGGGGDRGSYGGSRDRPSSRSFDRNDRPSRSFERSDRDAPRKFNSDRAPARTYSNDRNDRQGGSSGRSFDRSESRSSAPAAKKSSFGYGGSSSLYGSGDADAWEKKSSSSGGAGAGRGRRF